MPVRGGDYGTPALVTAFGATGGRVRVFLDGFELLPLDEGVPDLSRIGLVGLASVRLVRGLGGLVIELESHRIGDPRPLSIVEAGTGALRTNLLRGTFVHPRALGGSLGVGLERVDTRGPRGAESGAQTGAWLRYTLHRGDDAGLRFELRTADAESDLEEYPPSVSRRDWAVRGRYRLREGLVAEAFTGASSIDGGGDDLTPLEATRRQHGVRVGLEVAGGWARAAYRLASGPDLPSRTLELEAGADLPLGGFAGRLSRDNWAGRGATLTSLAAWTAPVFGLSAFASWEDGTSGGLIPAPRVPIEEEPAEEEEGEEEPPPEEPAPAPTHRFTERTGVRLGAAAHVGPLSLSAARVSLEADSLVPFGFLPDREGLAAPGGRFNGIEVWTRLALPLNGFGLYGSLVRWDRGGLYLPERLYTGGLDYHGLPMESGNLEIWASAGVEGRDPMLTALPVEGDPTSPPVLQEVPFGQSWHAFVQLRIVTVRIFIRFENLTVRENNQDIPGRVLPGARVIYGVRWTLWN
jgi:hypothetical protein